MRNFWLPSDRLSPKPLANVSPGQLIVMPPATGGQGPAGTPCQVPMGIRLAVDRGIFVFALTPFHGGGSPAWDAVELTMELQPVLTLDAALTFEADMTVPAVRGTFRDSEPGELVSTDDGIAITGAFGRHRDVYQFAGVIGIESWQLIGSTTSRIIFGSWRLRIDISGFDPIYWTQEIPASE